MLPNYQSGQVYAVNRAVYDYSQPKRGDVVAVILSGDNKRVIKRIVGLPGETVTISAGTVLVDGKLINEPYLGEVSTTPDQTIQLSLSQYFVLGDNRAISLDSRTFGPVTNNNIVGRVSAKLFN